MKMISRINPSVSTMRARNEASAREVRLARRLFLVATPLAVASAFLAPSWLDALWIALFSLCWWLIGQIEKHVAVATLHLDAIDDIQAQRKVIEGLTKTVERV